MNDMKNEVKENFDNLVVGVQEQHAQIAEIMRNDDSWMDNEKNIVRVARAIYLENGSFGRYTQDVTEALHAMSLFNAPNITTGTFWKLHKKDQEDQAGQMIDAPTIVIDNDHPVDRKNFPTHDIELYVERLRHVLNSPPTITCEISTPGYTQIILLRSEQSGSWTVENACGQQLLESGTLQECIDTILNTVEIKNAQAA